MQHLSDFTVWIWDAYTTGRDRHKQGETETAQRMCKCVHLDG